MSTQPDQELAVLYSDYLKEAERVKKERIRVYNQYRLGIFAGLIIMIGALLGLPPYAFWVGLIITVGGFFVAYVMADKHAAKEADRSAQSRPGFIEFYKLYFNRRWWPDELATGEKYDKFLSILGRKGSE
jgi:hypothetical protein